MHPSEHHVTNNEAAENRAKRMEEAREQATRAINKKATIKPLAQYKPRDQVWLEATHLKLPNQGTKLNSKCYGPFKILKEISPVVFKLDLPISWTVHPVFHTSLLTPYVKTLAHSPNYSCPPPDLINDEEQYEVEQIRNHQLHRCSRMLQYLIKWWGYPESDNTWEPADQVYALDLFWEYYKCQPLKNIKGKQKPLAKTAIRILSLSKPFIIASQWPSLLPRSQSSSPDTSNLSRSSSLTSLLTLPHTPTPYPPTRSPSPGPSMTSRPMPFGMGPSHLAQSRTSSLDMRTLHLPSYRHLSLVSPPPYSRERRYTIVRLTTSDNTLWMSMLSAALSNSVFKTLMVSHCCALMDLRTIMDDSPYLLSPMQVGRVLLSSSSNWMTDKWWDLAPWQEVSMMLISSTSLLHRPLTSNPWNHSPTGSTPVSGATTLTSICFVRLSLPSTTGGFSLRSSNTESWTERLLCYRRNLAWWMQTLQHLNQPSRHVRTILSPRKWQRRLSQWGLSISNCR